MLENSLKTYVLCCWQLCSDSVDLSSDTVSVDSMSHDSILVDGLMHKGQMKPGVTTHTPLSAQLRHDISHSSELTFVDLHTYKQDSAMSSATAIVPSIITPSTSAQDHSLSQASNISVRGQQRPKSLDQEFTLLNLDIPNVTIHDVCLRFQWH